MSWPRGRPARRGERALAAAQASLRAGAFDAALGLVAIAEAGPLDEFKRALVDLLRGYVAFASGLQNEASTRLLLNAAGRLEPFDPQLARETYLTAWAAAVNMADLAAPDLLPEICRTVRALPRSVGDPRPLDMLLDGLALLTTDGRAAAVPTLQRVTAAVSDIPVEDVLRWGWAAVTAGGAVWDDDAMHEIPARQVQLVRDAGAIVDHPQAYRMLDLGPPRQLARLARAEPTAA